MLSCKQVTQLASEHVDKRLPLMTRLNMALHLLICHHCRRYIRQFRASISLTKQAPRSAPTPEQLDEQVKKLIEISSK